jgi:MtN3 and saliva related transmembrane protein
MDTLSADLLGYAAGTMTTLAFLPQAMRTLKTRRTNDISLAMYLIFTLGVGSWLVYGLLIGSWPVILANAVTLLFCVAILVMKLRFDRKGCNGQASGRSALNAPPAPPGPPER